MADNIELESRLRQWAREYGLGGLPGAWPKHNILAAPAGSTGFTPIAIHTAADDVETVVAELESDKGGFREGRVLRMDYYCPDWAMEARLIRLRRIGCGMSRAGYYMHLERAKWYVAAKLNLAPRKVRQATCV